MAKNIFKASQEQAIAAGIVPHTDESSKWFREKVSNIRKPDQDKLIRESDNKHEALPKRPKDILGHLWTYKYEPKAAKTLKYYDKYPLSMIVKVEAKSFDALNFHYLPTNLRFVLFKALTEYKIDATSSESSRIRITYDILKMTRRLQAFRPCYKKYLYTHVESKYVKIDPDEWDLALALPTYKFVNGKKEEVWTDSRRQINGTK